MRPMKKLDKGKKGTHGALSKVMPAEALVGMLLAMGTGASNAPKGGLYVVPYAVRSTVPYGVYVV